MAPGTSGPARFVARSSPLTHFFAFFALFASLSPLSFFRFFSFFSPGVFPPSPPPGVVVALPTGRRPSIAASASVAAGSAAARAELRAAALTLRAPRGPDGREDEHPRRHVRVLLYQSILLPADWRRRKRRRGVSRRGGRAGVQLEKGGGRRRVHRSGGEMMDGEIARRRTSRLERGHVRARALARELEAQPWKSAKG